MGASPQRFRLQYLPLFWDDLNSAVSYLSDVLENPRAAHRMLDEVERKILDHLENPTLAAVYKPTSTRPRPYYWFPVGSYMVFYVVYDDVMEVRRFLYGAKDLRRMLP